MATVFCTLCNAPMVERKGKFGAFLGCTNYPTCKGIQKITFQKREVIKTAIPTDVTGTPQQDEVWHAVKHDTQHIIISALAGCGKTFTIVQSLRYVTGTVIFVAFNKHIVEELETKIPDNMIAKTMNSFGYAQVRQWNPRVKFEEDKLWRIIDTYVNSEDENADFIKNAVASLVNLCKVNLIDGKNTQQLDSLVEKHGIELNDSVNAVYTLVPQVLIACKVQKGTIDFADQLWFIFAHNIPVAQYNVMIADEIQDWNPLQQYVAMRAIVNGRFIGVGDENQAIYGFSGADTNSIANMIALLKNTSRGIKVMPLTQTYRCPVSHVELARQIVPQFEAKNGAINGTVQLMTRENAITSINRGNMVICRRNAPLISVAYALIKQNIPVVVKGRDIGKGLIVLVNKLKAKNTSELIDKVESYRAKEIEKLQKKGKRTENQIQSLNDKVDTLIAIADGKNTINEVISFIDTLFSDFSNGNAVTLSSVHRAKGLESTHVYVLEYDRIEIPMKNEEFAQQEKNLHYIALTRSKDTLVLIVG